MSVDGQHLNSKFVEVVNICFGNVNFKNEVFQIPVTWDPCNFLICAVADIREGKMELVLTSISRYGFINRFTALMRGKKNFTFLRSSAKKHQLTRQIPQVYAAQRFVLFILSKYS